jgi:hypothetical protein
MEYKEQSLFADIQLPEKKVEEPTQDIIVSFASIADASKFFKRLGYNSIPNSKIIKYEPNKH